MFAVLTLVLTSACGGSDGGSSTRPSDPTLNGTWSGPATDSSGGGPMSWQLTETGQAVSGSVTITDTATGINGRGTLSATLAGAALHFSIAIPAGGFDAPFASCTATITGDGQVAAPTLTGTYTGTNSCGGSVQSGSFTLSKQS